MKNALNILIVNDDGPDAEGVRVLRRVAIEVWPRANTVTLVPEKPSSGAGMSITPGLSTEPMEINEAEEGFYICGGKPADLIYHAFLNREDYLFSGRWDLVLSGINHGQNVGFDVYHSGTVGAAIVASWMFGCPAYAFSKEMKGKHHEIWKCKDEFEKVESGLYEYLSLIDFSKKGCWNVNYPKQTPKGSRQASVASRSRWNDGFGKNRKHSFENDMALLEKGYTTISNLQVDMNNLNTGKSTLNPEKRTES